MREAAMDKDLQLSLDPGQQKRLASMRKDLLRESDVRRFDPRPLAVLRKYVAHPVVEREIDDIVNYLHDLHDPEGRPFCKSLKRYSDMEEVWDNFQKEEKDSFMWNRHARRALQKVISRYAKAKLTMIEPQTDEQVQDLLQDWTTSAGWEKILTGKLHKVEYLPGIQATLAEEISAAKARGSFGKPILPGTRCQGGGAFNKDGSYTNTCKMKTRPINMVDLYVVLAEAMFGKPLSSWLKSYAYSNIGKPDAWTSRWVHHQQMCGRSFISLDYSKYDSTIPSWLIHAAFQVIKSAFAGLDDELLSVIEHDFIHKTLITGTGTIEVHHGNPSGSNLTAIVNGICNEIMTETWADWLGFDLEFNVMGDDNLIYFVRTNGVTIDEEMKNRIGSYISHNFGVKVNLDKTNWGSYSDDPEYLSRWWTPSGPYRPTGDIIAMMCYPERFRNYEKKVDGHFIITPELIVFSMILGYPATMRKIMDVDRFTAETKLGKQTVAMSAEAIRELPWNVRTWIESESEGRHRIKALNVA